MKLTADEALRRGIAAQKAGKLQDAERLYRAILRVQPEHPDANHNLGVLAVSLGKFDHALPFLRRALDANFRVEQFWLSYIDGLIKCDRIRDASQILADAAEAGVNKERLATLHNLVRQRVSDESSLEGAFSFSGEPRGNVEKGEADEQHLQRENAIEGPSQDQMEELLALYRAGRLDEAETLATSLTQSFPYDPFGWKLLGAALKDQGRVSEALTPKQRSVEVAPDDANAHFTLGVTLKELGRTIDAEASYRKAIALRANYAEAHSNLGITLQEQGRLEEAEAALRQAIAANPHYAEAYSNLGVNLRAQSKLEQAEESLRQAVTIKADLPEAHYNLANYLRELGRLNEAAVSYEDAIAIRPDYPQAYGNLGATLQDLGKLDDAKASYETAISLKPDYAKAHRNYSTIKTFESKDEQFFQMQKIYEAKHISKARRCHICFALAKACEDLKDFSAAYQFYNEGNALRREQLGYDLDEDARLFDAFKHCYEAHLASAVELENLDGGFTPIFIVGMPRSGTTLVEQIISSHSMVTGAGELTAVSQFGLDLAIGRTSVDGDAVTAFRQQYLSYLMKRSEGKNFITDKMPQNFQFLGLIATAFPEAKIVHVVRDRAAVCWANYTQYFMSDNLRFCYDLAEILGYYNLYRDLMNHWSVSFPERIYDLSYEALTENQQAETRELIDHLGLTWEDSCLSPQENKRSVASASNAQIRQKVYRGSSERWKLYRPYLNGLLDS